MSDTEKLFCVYIHKNKINGKMYVGITCKKNPKDRWGNGNGYKYNQHFYGAIQKYGWDNFEHEIILTGLTEEEASKKEKELIKTYNTTDRRFGYNFADGGLNGRGLTGELNPFYGKVPEAAVQASIKARTGKKLSEEHKAKIRAGNKKATIHENSLRALKEYGHLATHYSGKKNPKSKAVMCVETGVTYESQRIAENELGLPRSSIHQALKNNIRAGGYHWVFTSNSNDQSKDVGSSESKRRDANVA